MKRTTMATTAVFMLVGLGATSVLSQPIIPNPLVRPAPAAGPGGAVPPPSEPGQVGSPQASGRLPQGREDLSGQRADQEKSGIPLVVQERLSGFYVAAIVGKSAILRGQMAAQLSPASFVAGQGPAGNAAAGQGGATAGQPTAVQPGSAQGQMPVYRSVGLMVRDGQVINLVDRHQVLARVTRDSVVLYLLADPAVKGEGSRVVFRGGIDSLISSPPVPLKSLLETPDGGIDGKARRELSNVEGRGQALTGRPSNTPPNGTSPSTNR